MDVSQLYEDLLAGKTKYLSAAELAVQWHACDRHEASSKLYALLNARPREYLVKAILPLLADLACRDESWNTIIAKSLKKRGRCPLELRDILRVAIRNARQQIPQLDSDITTEPLFGTMAESEHREVSEEAAESGISIDKRSSDIIGTATRLLPRLYSASVPRWGRGLHVDFCHGEHFYVFGLAVLALWVRQKGAHFIEAKNLPGIGRDYLDAIGFFDFAEGKSRRVGDPGWSIGIQSLDNGGLADQVAGDFVRICDSKGTLSFDDRNGLTILFAELIENVTRHGGEDVQATVGAQYYPRRKKVSVIVADSGMGLLQSFRSGRNPRLKTLETDEDAILAAMQPLVTSKPVDVAHLDEPGHAGYGLYIASELAIRNGGTIAVTSGGSTVARYQKGFGRRKRTHYPHPHWQGTIIQIILDLNHLLDIGEVYRALPPAWGYEKEDFFE